MKILVAIGSGVVLVAGSLAAWSASQVQPPRVHPPRTLKVGTQPGGVIRRVAFTTFQSTPDDAVVGFSSGCFWGTEDAFRKIPGVIATAVGYTGGSTAFPTYQQAHATGHVETVLVEFNPKRTPLATLLKTFWSLHRSTESAELGQKMTAHSPAIWTYDDPTWKQATAGKAALERQSHQKLAVRILPAEPFYLAEDFHQQYDEKSGTESCLATP